MLKSNIMNIIKKYPGVFGIYIRCSDGQEFKLNTDRVFSSASLIKLFILLSIDTAILEDRVKVEKDHLTGGSGILGKLHSGLELTIKDLATLMITVSDNSATNILIDYIGMERINKNILKNGMVGTVLQRKMMDMEALKKKLDNFTTPEDVMKVLNILYKNPVFYDMLLSQQLNNKISLYFSENPDFSFAHKTGELMNVEHDAGRLSYRDRYIDIVVMSEDLTDNSDGLKIHNEIGEFLKKIIIE